MLNNVKNILNNIYIIISRNRITLQIEFKMPKFGYSSDVYDAGLFDLNFVEQQPFPILKYEDICKGKGNYYAEYALSVSDFIKLGVEPIK